MYARRFPLRREQYCWLTAKYTTKINHKTAKEKHICYDMLLFFILRGYFTVISS